MAAFFNNGYHHPLHVAELLLVLVEKQLGAGRAAEIEIIHAAVQHGLDLAHALIPVGSFEGGGLGDDLAQTASRALGDLDAFAAHAEGAGFVRSLFRKGERAAADGIKEQQTHGVHVCRRGGLTVPEQLRSHKFCLLALPVRALCRADGHISLFVKTDILRVHAAPVIARPGVLPDLRTEPGTKGTELPAAEFCYLISQHLLRVKFSVFFHWVSSLSGCLSYRITGFSLRQSGRFKKPYFSISSAMALILSA